MITNRREEKTMNRISIVVGKLSKKSLPEFLSVEATKPAREFHKTLPEYSQTPLANLKNLAKELGVKGIYIKDESKRFGLNAFKALGASYAISKIAENEEDPSRAVYVTATDGNHGKGVAWAAMKLGAQAEIFMPVGSMECRAEAIRSIGDSKVEITDMNYDDAVRFAADYAKKNGYHFVQDTGSEDYEEIPNCITQGYSTMAFEAAKQLESLGVEKPSHLFLQAGVGSMAGGVLGFLAHYYKKNPPITIVAEPWQVACIYESIKSGNDGPTNVGGFPKTIMAGLNCGEPNPFTWPVLRDFASFAAKCGDDVTRIGMKMLAHPIGDDPVVVSGESGAVGLGLLYILCTDSEYAEYKNLLGIDENSEILIFSTEGDTDPEGYNEIVNGE